MASTESTPTAVELAARLAEVATILGLTPSSLDVEGRSAYLAYLIADGAPEDAIDGARRDLEAVSPGQLKRIEKFRRQWFPDVERTPA